MAASFDPYDKDSWFFGPISRQEAGDLLMSEKEGGVFLVRESSTILGDLVLCVREDSKVSHYIINKLQQENGLMRYRIGDQVFPDIPSLLSFYKLHYLDTTPLIRPAPKKIEKVRAKYDFDGNDSDDLPFKRGEVLTVVSKDEEQWWTARNSIGQTGSIPVPYIEKYEDGAGHMDPSTNPQSLNNVPSAEGAMKYNAPSIIQRILPALARVKQLRVPCAYDKTALKLEVGDVVKVTKMNINGQWEGEIDGRVGHFPFTHVEFIDSENPEEDEA